MLNFYELAHWHTGTGTGTGIAGIDPGCFGRWSLPEMKTQLWPVVDLRKKTLMLTLLLQLVLALSILTVALRV